MTYLPRGLLVNLLQGLIIAAAYFRFATKLTHTHIELSCKGRLAWLQLAEEHFNLMKHFTPSLSASVSALQAKRKTLKMEECVQTRVRRVWVFYYYTFISLRFLSNSVGINKFLVFSCFILLNIASV